MENHQPFHLQLRRERVRRSWSQMDLASKLNIDAKTVSRWERGNALPSPYYRQQLIALFGKDAGTFGLFEGTYQDEPLQTTELREVSIRINEEPLTAQNFAMIVSALTELYTKCWLIEQHQLSNLIEYTQTHDPRFAREANLVITKLVHNSPAEIKLETGFSPKDLGEGLKLCMEALRTGIDAITQTSYRAESLDIDNQAKKSDIKQKELETKSVIEDKEQSRQIEAQRAEQDHQLFLIERERKNLELLEKRLDIEKKRIEYALEIANNMVNIVNPNASAEVRAMLVQTMLPNLLQLGSSNGLELVVPTSEIP